MSDTKVNTKRDTSRTADFAKISELTPFSKEDLVGEQFARGNMLGGANPLESSAPASWKR